MSRMNDGLKDIPIKEFLVVIILFYLFWFLINEHISSVSANWIYIFIIFYFLFKLRKSLPDFKSDFSDIFSRISFKEILFIIVLNIFFSYGMLYLANFLISIPFVEGIVNFSFSSMSLLAGIGTLTVIVISPISEELIFRGVFLNKLRIIVPTVFAVLISSLLFALLHSFGNIFSAFIFAVCMGVFYLKTDNILVPIFAHFLNNLIAETIVYFDSANVIFMNGSVVLLISVLALVSFIVLVYYLYHELNNYK